MNFFFKMSRQSMSWNVKLFSHVKIVLFYVILHISHKGDFSFKMVGFLCYDAVISCEGGF